MAPSLIKAYNYSDRNLNKTWKRTIRHQSEQWSRITTMGIQSPPFYSRQYFIDHYSIRSTTRSCRRNAFIILFSIFVHCPNCYQQHFHPGEYTHKYTLNIAWFNLFYMWKIFVDYDVCLEVEWEEKATRESSDVFVYLVIGKAMNFF